VLIVGLEGGQYSFFRFALVDGNLEFDKLGSFQSKTPALPIGCFVVTERGQRVECSAKDWPPLPLAPDGVSGTATGPTPHRPHFVIFGFDNQVRVHTSLSHNTRFSKTVHEDESFFVRMFLLDQLGTADGGWAGCRRPAGARGLTGRAQVRWGAEGGAVPALAGTCLACITSEGNLEIYSLPGLKLITLDELAEDEKIW